MDFAPILWIFPAALVAAGLCDLRARVIPNRLNLGLALAFAIPVMLTGMHIMSVAAHLIVAGMVVGLGIACFAAGWIGGGDGKLMAATALWLGPAATLSYLLYSALAGGVLATVVLIYRTAPLPAHLAETRRTAALAKPNAPLPYGVALAVGGLAAMPGSTFF